MIKSHGRKMGQATIRLYAELNDFLPEGVRQMEFVRPFPGSPAVKDLIESLGVPHTEVDLILVNGNARPFDHGVQDGDRISVFPVFESLDISPLSPLRPKPLRETRFILDVHLGRLAAYLRMLGFDALYRNDFDDETLATISVRELRILLTRDRQLLKRKALNHGYFVREEMPRRQAAEVLRRFDLVGSIAPFRRCLACNGTLRQIDSAEASGRVPEDIARTASELAMCTQCMRVYWKGSHYQRMAAIVEELTREAAPADPNANA